MNVAVDGSVLEIELRAPAANIVGFEHAPRSGEQKAALNAALAELRDADRLFRLPGAAGCRVEMAEAHSTLESGHEHAQEPEGAHAHDHDHSDIVAHYRFQCERPAQLRSIDVRLFERFPANEHLEVQLLTATRQQSLRLEAGRSRIRL